MSELFGLHNLPYGAVVGPGGPFVCVRFGDAVLDLGAAERAGLVGAGGTFQGGTLNAFMALGRPQWTAVRSRIRELLAGGAPDALLHPLDTVRPVLPFAVADYVDF